MKLRFAELRCRLLSRTFRLPVTHPLQLARATSNQRYRGQVGGTYCIHSPFFAAGTTAAEFQVLRDECTYRKQPITLIPPVNIPRPRVQVQWNDAEDLSWTQIQSRIAPSDAVVFTDGSVEDNPGRGGAAIYAEVDFTARVAAGRSLGGMVTISYAELVAIEMAVDWSISQLTLDNRFTRVFILTDSKYALFVIKGRWEIRKHRRLILTIRHKMLVLRNSVDVLFYKIPAHCDIKGNERADQLAKKAMQDSTEVPVVPVDYDTAKVLIHRAATKLWEQSWSRSSTQLRSIVKRVTAGRRRHLDGCSRRTSTIITQLATGHFPVSKYLAEKQGCSDLPCECGLVESVEHLLLDCECHHRARIRMLEVIQQFVPGNTDEIQLSSLLFANSNRRRCYAAVCEFLAAIDRLPF